MASIPSSPVTDKPTETNHPSLDPLMSQDPEMSAQALHTLVEHTEKHADVTKGIHAQMHKLLDNRLVQRLIPGLEKIADEYHVGNFVIDRTTGKRFFESMPIYPRLGMHLMFYGGTQVKLLHNQTVENIMKDLSVKQGKVYDSPDSVKSIPSFIETYSIELDELLEPDVTKYKSFNEFFYRKVKPDARPVQNADDPNGVCSVADCRLTVYQTIDLATKFWIKGQEFNVPALLNVSPFSEVAQQFQGASLASFRLAPADYHRFHSPIDGTLGPITHIPGQYYTVNPQAVNEPGFDVFGANKRSVLYMRTPSGLPVAFVAIGALLVGSIAWTKEEGAEVRRGDELGYFAYGGSTVVVLFPRDTIQFDEDLIKNSEAPIETFVKVGWSVGKFVPRA